MGLKGKLVSTTSIKSDGFVFHNLFKEPHHLSKICPDTIESVDLHSGQWGAVGAVTIWNFTMGGKKSVSIEMIEAIDEQNKSITYKVVEGDLADVYKSLKYIIKVDTNGEDNLVTWTLEYEKKNENVPDPCALMDVCVNVTKDIERHCLLVPN
ncbi:hypothetical protein BUALT_Bualt05G0110500 [Buddleja alternifolia]|uniref:Bet v I/Major latex protein domain-containing protein n=1 Tax=Buddleja alternifolia TaxID=168488 RepID=A0AAV6XRR4_9LAMI|nr:hypothetical protein BUALT_Bualt05G0110500 [Buddleja alternifolia]